MRLKTTASLLLSLCLGQSPIFATSVSSPTPSPERPRIVVGMVVDQMSWDYLYRYNAKFAERGGFKRLLTKGFNCQNARINYIPSVTAIGHTTVYTGSVPSIHGIAGNHFYKYGAQTYCTEDPSESSVGTTPGKSGAMSPRNLLSTTITDELRIATNFRSRTIGIALKDRGAILPAGRSATAAYWMDDKSGSFITSTYYMTELPRWVKRFNDRRLPEQYLKKDWKPLYRINQYSESIEDNNSYEHAWGEIPATLPLPTSKLMQTAGLGVIRSTPMGNTLTLEMAKAAIEGERLGQRPDSTDFLAVSLSSTDYIGHRYGSFSVELEDTYLRLDRDLGDFFDYLDQKYGQEGYLFFITADHAVAHNTAFLADRKLPSGQWRLDKAMPRLDSVARSILGTDDKVVLKVMNYQLFLDEAKLQSLKTDRQRLLNALQAELVSQEGVAYAVIASQAELSSLPQDIKSRIINGYNQHRSGAIFIVLHPGWSAGNGNPERGANHSVWSPYDTHIPLIFMGHKVKAGSLYREVHMTDIAPTLAMMLKTQLPSGAIGRPITEILED